MAWPPPVGMGVLGPRGGLQELIALSYIPGNWNEGVFNMTVRQANWCQCSRCESGRREKASHHLHPESWAVIREAGG